MVSCVNPDGHNPDGRDYLDAVAFHVACNANVSPAFDEYPAKEFHLSPNSPNAAFSLRLTTFFAHTGD
jgi:hypothetical protein